MSDVAGKFFIGQIRRSGTSGSSPGFLIGEADAPDPVNPPGSVPGGGGRDEDAVHYDADDGKNATEKQRARTNIGSTSSIPQVVTTLGAINNLAKTSNCIYFTGSGSVTLGGIEDGLNGEEVVLVNLTGQSLFIQGNNGSTSTLNRFDENFFIPDKKKLLIKYYEDRWRASDPLSSEFIDIGKFQFIVNSSNSISQSNTINIRANQDNGSRFVLTWGGQTNPGNGGARINGCISTPRSSNTNDLVRRDELFLNYGQISSTSGTINDFSPANGVKLIEFSQGPTITGISNTENRKSIYIYNRNSSLNLTIKHQDSGSLASNRFDLNGSDLIMNPNEVYQFIYLLSRWRRVF